MTPEGAPPAGPPLGWTWLGRAAYRPTWDLQERLRERVVGGDVAAERLLFLEHAPVITLGRHARPTNLLVAPAELARRGVEVVETSRGGDVTYHGPGQLVIYPVVRLTAGVARHVESIGQAIAAELQARGVDARFRTDPAGVWVGDAKIAACGVHVGHGVAIHGYALNVAAEALAGFRLIVPCGLTGARVTALAAESGGDPPGLEELAAALAGRIAAAWGRPAVLDALPDIESP